MPAAENKKYLDIIERLRPFDDIFMRILFKDNKELVQRILNILLNRTDIKIRKYEIQKDMKQVLSRSIIPDIVIEDTDGNIYDIEVERSAKKAPVERLRYYASVLDVEYAKKNIKFDEIRNIHILFITEEDYYHKGYPVYHIQRTIKELNHCPFKDRMNLYYVNGQYRNQDELGYLMHDFSCSDYQKMVIEELRDSVRKIKTREKEKQEMCELLEEFAKSERAQGRLEGKREGILEGKLEGKREGQREEKISLAVNMTKMGFNLETISQALNCSIDSVKELLASKKLSV